MERITDLLAAMLIVIVATLTQSAGAKEIDQPKPIRAGACAVDITPEKLPVVISGGFLEGRAGKVRDRLYARCLVPEAGSERVAIVVVDTLMMPRSLLDAVKASAAKTTGIKPDRMIFFNGNKLNQVLIGKTKLSVNRFYHVVLVRTGRDVAVYLNGASAPDISGQAAPGCPGGAGGLFIGGRNDNFANFEGRMDEVSVYNRSLKPAEIAEHYRAAMPGRLGASADNGKKQSTAS